MRRVLFFSLLFALLLMAHLLQSGVLWEPEEFPLAAAMQIKRGAMLYRDIWFDKPPLLAFFYLVAGPALRIFGAVFALGACLLVWAVPESRKEGYFAAGLLAFFLTFDTYAAVVPIGADMLLLAPHLAAILLVLRKRFFWSGMVAGVGFLCNAKALFVLAACAIFAGPAVVPLIAGFALPCLIALAWLAGVGALTPYLDQAWGWPAQYAASSGVAFPLLNGVTRTLGWLGFHAVLLTGLLERRWKWIAWAVLCFCGVALGGRFFPRYFLLLLPCLVLMAAHGLARVRLRGLAIAAMVIAMAVPLIRFGPGYLRLASSRDLAMDRDGREAAKIALSRASANSTLYVWGYRPEIFIYTGLKAATRYLDSQAMTGVPADRHLTQSTVVLTKGTQEAREELAHSKPDVLIDGLSLFNPKLAMDRYEELRPWLAGYHEVARTKETIIYLRN